MAHFKTATSSDSFHVGIAFGKQIAYGHRHLLQNSVLVNIKSVDNPVRSIQFSHDGRHLVTCGDDKKTILIDTKDSRTVGERILPKRPSSFWFSRDGNMLLVADKSGEVNRYGVPELSDVQQSLMLGHTSIVLDMTLLERSDTGQQFVATCDRDEKIRVSHYPNAYNIQSYCLHHTSFVSCLCRVDCFPRLLLSGGGDGLVCVWDWYNGELLSVTDLQQEPSQERCQDDDVSVVTSICIVSNQHTDDPLFVAVATNKYPGVRLFSLDSSGLLQPSVFDVRLGTPPWSIDGDGMGRLWVCRADKNNPVKCYRPTGDKIVEVDSIEEPLLTDLNKLNIMEGAKGLDFNWSELRKHDIDNMTHYLTKKQERIQLRGREGLESVLDSDEQDENPKDPKLIKVDDSLSEH